MKALIATLTLILACTVVYSPAALASSNVAVTPNPASPGQTVTVAGTVTISSSNNGVSVTVWLVNAGSTVATTFVRANFTANQPTNVSIPVALPSTAPTGAYTVSLGVYNSAGTQLYWTGTAASFTVGTPTGSGVKWHAGHYAGSNAVVTASNAQWASRQAEIDLALSQANVKGYYDIHQWGSIETGQGVYNFANIDQSRNYIATHYPGKRYGVIILFEQYGSGPASSGAGVIPAYVLNNPTTYGSLGTPDGSGGWQQMAEGATAAWWRSAVAGRIGALFAALAAHTSPYGSGAYTYDTDPYFEMVTWDESVVNLSPANGDYSFSGAQTQWNNINAAIVQAFPHTNVIDQNSWFGWTGSNATNTAQIEVTGANQGLALGGADITTTGGLSWGQNGYIGAPSAGTSAMFGVAPYLAFVETPDYPAGISGIFNIATGPATSSGLNSSQIWWEMVQGGGTGDWQTQVLPFINAHPIPTGNTVCPTDYNARGGCNTN